MSMLNLQFEKRNKDCLLINEEVPTGATPTNPFECADDIVLSGTLTSITKGEMTLRPKPTIIFAHQSEELSQLLKEDQIRNASKDLEKSPGNPFILNNLGLVHRANKNFDKALECFIEAIRIKPDFAIAFLNLGSIYLMQKKYDKALEIYEKLLKGNPSDTRALINIGDIYFKDKKFKEAVEVYNTIIKINPSNIEARNRLALINLINGKPDVAISELRKILQINNSLPSIHNNLGIAYSVIGNHDKGIQAFHVALCLSPNYINALHNLAMSLKLKHELLEAIDLLEEYLQRNENIQTRELLSGFYFENKQYQKSLKNLSLVITNAINNNALSQEIARLYNNIGVVYRTMGDFKNAKDSYFTCVEKIGYSNHVIVENIIELYFGSGNTETAKKYIDILHEQFGTKGLYYYYIALYNFYNGQVENAIKFLNQLLTINEKFPPAYSFLSFIYSEYLNNYKKAISVNEKGIKNLPNNQITINNLAYNYLMNCDIEKAKNILKKIEDVTKNVFLTATTGLLMLKEGNIEEGRRMYNLAAQNSKTETLRRQVLQKKYIELAKYYLNRKDIDSAKTNLEKAISIKIKNSVYTSQAIQLAKEKLGLPYDL